LPPLGFFTFYGKLYLKLAKTYGTMATVARIKWFVSSSEIANTNKAAYANPSVLVIIEPLPVVFVP
jgi:hypothetical protein